MVCPSQNWTNPEFFHQTYPIRIFSCLYRIVYRRGGYGDWWWMVMTSIEGEASPSWIPLVYCKFHFKVEVYIWWCRGVPIVNIHIKVLINPNIKVGQKAGRPTRAYPNIQLMVYMAEWELLLSQAMRETNRSHCLWHQTFHYFQKTQFQSFLNI